MTRMMDRLHHPPGQRIRFRRIRRSCLYGQPDRRSPRPDAGAGARTAAGPGAGRAPGVARRHCRYALQTSPPLFRQRRR
jgi:hypothetical protein